jgi:hypothetical protein
MLIGGLTRSIGLDAGVVVGEVLFISGRHKVNERGESVNEGRVVKASLTEGRVEGRVEGEKKNGALGAS